MSATVEFRIFHILIFIYNLKNLIKKINDSSVTMQVLGTWSEGETAW
jgi:hypothetical protein